METTENFETENASAEKKQKLRGIIITTIITSIVCLIPCVIGLIIWNKLPDQIASHFNFNEVPDKVSSKEFVVFGFPCYFFALNLLCNLLIYFSEKKGKTKSQPRVIYYIVGWLVPVVALVVSGIIYAYALGIEVSIFKWLAFVLSVLFIIMGNYIPKAEQNRIIGFRTKSTLENPELWRKVNRFGGWVLVLGGIINLLLLFTPLAKYVFLISLAIIALLPAIYLIILKQRMKKTD